MIHPVDETKRTGNAGKSDVAPDEDLRKLTEDKYRYLFEVSPAIALVLGIDGSIVEVNGALEKATGFARKEIVGKSAVDFVVPAMREQIVGLLRLIAEGEWTPAVEVDVVAKDGTTRTILFSPGHAFVYEGTTPVAFLLTGIDVTERRRTAERLMKAARMEALVGLAGSIAHDFNNLLTVILNYTGLALREQETLAETRDMLGEVMEAGKRAQILTQKLLMFSRPQPQPAVLVDLSSLVRGLADRLVAAAGRSWPVSFDLAPELPEVQINPGLVESALFCLVANAVESMPEGGPVAVAAANVDVQGGGPGEDMPDGRYVTLSVTDAGKGIDESIRERIFEPFFTAGKSDQAKGLGLSVVYGAVRQCGGHVTVQSTVGKGTRVTMYFPAA
jgi:two-component system cell cycle sensor histidine kinase/response regulator CckA